MKNLIVFICVVCAQISFSQVSKKLGDFDAVSVFDKIEVELIKSSENKIIINGDRASEVELITKNSELKIRMPFPKLLSGESINIQLFYKNIESISASEGSTISCNSVLKATIIAVSAREGAIIDLDIDTQKVKVKAVTGGIISLSGTATNQDINLMTGGIVDAKKLVTSQTTVNVSAGGKAEINATTLVDAKVRAGGSVMIYGQPTQINKETILGGKIEEIN